MTDKSLGTSVKKDFNELLSKWDNNISFIKIKKRI